MITLRHQWHDVVCDYDGCPERFDAPRPHMGPNKVRARARASGWQCDGRDWRDTGADLCPAHRTDVRSAALPNSTRGAAPSGLYGSRRTGGDPSIRERSETPDDAQGPEDDR